MAELKRDIRYIDRDFNDFRNKLINYSQTYFPDTYNDFTPDSTGMLFIEMASYVGDVLSFYLDNQVQETFIQYARETENLFNMAYMLGYKPKVTTAASVDIDFYQQIPAKTSASVVIPDFNYSLLIPENTAVTANNASATGFLIEDVIDFSASSSLDPTTISVYQISGATPTSFLAKKTRKAISATINTQQFNFEAPVRFNTVDIFDSNIIGILDCIDSDGNEWYEVPNLAQENVFDTIRNTNTNDPNVADDGSGNDVPYLLQLKSVQRRFAARFTNTGSLQLQFGAGNFGDNDEEIIPNPDNVGLGLPFEQNKLTTAYSPTNFVFTNTYGTAPSNTTLTVRYLTGGGVSSNIDANTLNTIDSSAIKFLNIGNNNTPTSDFVFNSIATNNPSAASGGGGGDTIEEIRQNSLSNFNTQQRNVTADDYLIRALSMPPKYGVVAKAFTAKASTKNPDAILDLYILTQDLNGNLIKSSNAIKNNLKTYINQYRMIGDSVNIKDAFIVNIGCEFDIITLPNYNNNEILTKCIGEVQGYFLTRRWQINQPIVLREITLILDAIPGVQTVSNIQIINKAGTTNGYSEYAYSIPGATQGGVIYPSLDPSIFEVKFPNDDIKGRIVSLGTGTFGYGGY